MLRGWDNSTRARADAATSFATTLPTIAGFVVTAAWGEDDLWDVALTYNGKFGEFSVLAKVGYGESTDPVSYGLRRSDVSSFKCKWGGAAATIEHNPTGLYLYGGYGKQKIDSLGAGVETATARPGSCSPASRRSGRRSAPRRSSASIATTSPARAG